MLLTVSILQPAACSFLRLRVFNSSPSNQTPILSIDTLTQELINLIASFIPKYEDEADDTNISLLEGGGWSAPFVSEIPPLATLSRTWKKAIEARTFQSLAIQYSELEKIELIVTGSRREYVAHLTYHIQLPDLASEDFSKAENVLALLLLLKEWETDDVQTPMRLGNHADQPPALSMTIVTKKTFHPRSPSGGRFGVKRRRNATKVGPRISSPPIYPPRCQTYSR